MRRLRRNAALAMLGGLLTVQCGLPALAVRTGVRLDTSGGDNNVSVGLVTIGHIPASADVLAVVAEDASVNIVRSSKATDIVVATNQPRDWNISGSTIRQAAMMNSRGVAMLSDKMGSRCIANGKVYALPPGPIKGGISLNKDGVMVGGQKLEPIPGSNVPGIGAGDGEHTAADQPGRLKGRVTLPDTAGLGSGGGDNGAVDKLEIIVPESFNGSLKIGAAGRSEIQLSGWNGGTFEAYLTGQGNMSAGNLHSLSKAVLDISGTGLADVKNLTAKVLVANINGTGKINVGAGGADMSNATVNGLGSITLKGEYKNLKQDVQGQGTISVSK